MSEKNAVSTAGKPEALNYRSLKEAAAAIGVALPQMYRVVQRADFPGYKIGDRWIIPKKELAEWNSKMAREKAEL